MKRVKNKPLIEFDKKLSITYADGSPAKIKNLEKREEISDELFCILTKSNGEKLVFKSRPFKYQKKTFISPFPNPIILLLNTAVDCYNNSKGILEYLIQDTALDNEEHDIHVLEIDEDNLTNENYNRLIQNKIVSIISLVTAIEAFLNIQIPNDFIYEQDRDGKTKSLNKKQIESTKVHFREKLTKVISQVIGESDFEKENSEFLESIVELYKVRREIIHLKTNGDDIFSIYFKSIGLISDIDLENSIENVTKYFNLVSPGYAV